MSFICSLDDLLGRGIGFPQEKDLFMDVRYQFTKTGMHKFQNSYSHIDQTVSGYCARVWTKIGWISMSSDKLETINESLTKLVDRAKKVSQLELPPFVDSIEKSFVAKSKGNIGPESDKQLLDLLNKVPSHRLLVNKSIEARNVSERKIYLNNFGSMLSLEKAYAGLRLSIRMEQKNRYYEDYLDFYEQSADTYSNWTSQTASLIEDSEQMLHASQIVGGLYKTVWAPGVSGLFAHECLGHNSEADLQGEGSKSSWKVGERVSHPELSIVDDGNILATGYCPFDDEGQLSKASFLVENGVLKDRLHSMATAKIFRELPTGNARSLDYRYPTLCRMTNTHIKPGKSSEGDILNTVDEGVYIKDAFGGSGMSSFTIRPRKCYQIKGGKIGQAVRVELVSGNVWEALKRVEAVGNRSRIENLVITGCGKYDQFPLPVSYGGAALLIGGITLS